MENNPESKLKETLFNLAFESTKAKFELLPVLSGLILALLAVSITGGLFDISYNIKWLATILLLLMILSLQIYYSEILKFNTEIHKKLLGLIGEKNTKISLNIFESLV